MKRLVLAASAQQDLSRIAQYTEREWGARQKTRYLGEIEERAPGRTARADSAFRQGPHSATKNNRKTLSIYLF